MSILKQIKWLLIDQFMFSMSGGGGGNTTSTGTTYTSNIPEYAKPYVMSMLGAGQSQIFNIGKKGNIESFKPYQAYSENVNDYFAGASPMQQQAYSGAANLQLPGQYQAGAQLAGAGGLGSLGLAGQMGQAGNNYFGMATNPGATQAFMNPYLKRALNPALEESRRQYGMNQANQQGNATRAGAFGGSREALMASENNRNMNMGMNQMIGTGYQNAYDAAQKNMQYGAGLGLQGQQAALQGYGQGIQAAGALGQLGSSQLAGQQNIINMQNQFGSAQQQAEQAKINQSIQDYATKQQYPMMQLANMSNLLHGLPMQSATTQTYAPAASNMANIAQLGTGIAGLAKLAAKGGVMKSYAGGGVTSLENRQRIASNYNPQQLEQSVQRGILPAGIGQVLANDYTNMQDRAQADQAAQVMAQQAAQPDPGVTGLPSNLPVMSAAQGGIIAFDEGGEVERFASKGAVVARDPLHWDYTPTTPDYTEAEAILAATRETPHSMDTVARAREVEEGKRGITDIFTPQLAKLQEKESKLGERTNRAQGLALLAASDAISKRATERGIAPLAAGFGGYGASIGASMDKIDALKENYDQQNNMLLSAQNAFKDAQLTNDTNRMDKAKSSIISAQQNIQKLKEDFAKTADTGNLKKAEKTADYYKDVSVESMKASNARITDMRNGIDIIYNSLTKPGPNGEPPKMAPGPQAKATALKTYQEQTGMSLEKLILAKELGAGKLNEDQKKTYANLTAKDSGYQILQTQLSQMKETNPKYAELKAKSNEIEKKHMTTALGGNAAAETKPAKVAKPAEIAKPMPAKKSALVKDTLYNTAQGPAIWDGNQFVAQ